MNKFIRYYTLNDNTYASEIHITCIYAIFKKILHILLVCAFFLFKYPCNIHALNIDTSRRAQRRLENLLNGSVQRATSVTAHPVFPSSSAVYLFTFASRFPQSLQSLPAAAQLHCPRFCSIIFTTV